MMDQIGVLCSQYDNLFGVLCSQYDNLLNSCSPSTACGASLLATTSGIRAGIGAGAGTLARRVSHVRQHKHVDLPCPAPRQVVARQGQARDGTRQGHARDGTRQGHARDGTRQGRRRPPRLTQRTRGSPWRAPRSPPPCAAPARYRAPRALGGGNGPQGGPRARAEGENGSKGYARGRNGSKGYARGRNGSKGYARGRTMEASAASMQRSGSTRAPPCSARARMKPSSVSRSACTCPQTLGREPSSGVSHLRA
jgi:hypothetical protein